MAHFVKTKTAIGGLSILVLILVPLFNTGKLMPGILNRWKQLTWEDFKGYPKKYSRFDAHIDTRIYLEYDDTLNRHRAYAAQNPVLSWVANDQTEPTAPLLRHEQYHFNLTEAIARSVDREFAEHSNETSSWCKEKIRKAEIQADSLQLRYDEDTYHGTIADRQREWELKINEMLLAEVNSPSL
jgi:hypothetical protein